MDWATFIAAFLKLLPDLIKSISDAVNSHHPDHAEAFAKIADAALEAKVKAESLQP